MSPDFIIIGAGRSGTTSLYHYLSQHPQIAMSRTKETNYFCWLIEGEAITRGVPTDVGFPVRSAAEYAAQFAHAGASQICGEASPRYLFYPGVAERLAAEAPAARLIVSLRDPAERAWSNWMGLRNAGREARSFEQVIEEEAARIDAPIAPGETAILRAGMYARCLSRYLALFPRDRLHVVVFEEFSSAPVEALTSLFGFLGVDHQAGIDTGIRYNPTGQARNAFLDRATAKSPLAGALKRALPSAMSRPLYRRAMQLRARNRTRPEMSPEARAALCEIYRADLTALEALLGRDFPAWRR